jgi:aldehyde:ferredoxin oxidoreductase
MRTLKGWALGVCVAARGGGHTTGSIHTGRHGLPPEDGDKLWGAPLAGDRLSYEDKAKVVWYMERLTAVCSSLGMCIFSSVRNDAINLLNHFDYALLFSAASGLEMTGDKIMMIGERIRNVEKAFNIIHAGFNRSDDYPPRRLMEEGIKTGPFKGERLERREWDKMLDEYYSLHGWDIKTSWPTRESLEKIGLEGIAGDLTN